jgi:ferredoxin
VVPVGGYARKLSCASRWDRRYTLISPHRRALGGILEKSTVSAGFIWRSPATISPSADARRSRQGRNRAFMKVWIDQDLCTGDGLCEEIAPDVFTLLDDGLAYVKEGSKVFSDPGGAEGMANVPAGMEDATIESAEECPGECIFIEIDE